MQLDKITWYWNRLRNMPAPEVTHRIAEAVRYRTYKIASRRGLPHHELNRWFTDRALEMLQLPAFRTRGAVVFQSDVRKQICSGVVPVLGATWKRASGWSADPRTNYVWPDISAHKISYRQSSGADPKGSWEVNRLLYLLVFSSPLTEADDDDSAKVVDSILADWLKQSRPGVGIAWTSGIEVALRSISLLLLLSSVDVTDETRLRARSSLTEHLNWLLRFPSLYSSANNHRVAELTAILLVSSALDGSLRTSDLAEYEAELLRVMNSLFASDGVGLEQSPTYAAFTLELGALCLHLHHWHTPTIRDALQAVLGSGFDSLNAFTSREGSIFRYGDDDDGKVLGTLVPDTEYVNLLAALIGTTREVPSPGVRVFPAGGHTVIRQRLGTDHEYVLLFDHAPLGWGSIAAHGHADTLHFSLYIDGLPWIADPGTYSYHGDSSLRDYFRSTASHNAPLVQQVDSSVMTGDFNWSQKYRAKPAINKLAIDKESFEISARHDGYESRFNTTVERQLACEPAFKRITVHDRLIGGEASFQVSFLIPSDCSIDHTDDGYRVSRKNAPAETSMSFSGADEVELLKPSESGAWYSPRFGERESAWILRAHARRRLTTTIEISSERTL